MARASLLELHRLARTPAPGADEEERGPGDKHRRDHGDHGSAAATVVFTRGALRGRE